MSRQKLRIPGRYERPAALRGPLGDQDTEAGIRAGYTAGVRFRQNVRALTAAHAAGQVGEPRELVNVATVESAGTRERIEISEADAGGRVSAGTKPATVTVDIIKSGWNKSGSRYYPAEVIERDIPKVYGTGTQMYINHPSVTEQDDRPERSLYDLAAVFIETPYAVQEGDRTVMRAAARVYSRHKQFLEEAQSDIGVSINGNGDGEFGEREGRSGLVLERLTHGSSVDFVTKPGAGGRIIALVEAARAGIPTVEAASLGAWLEAQLHLGFTQIADGLYGDGRLTRPERIAASSAVGDALGAFVTAIESKAPDLYKRDRWATPDDAGGDGETETREASVDTQRARLDQALSAVYGGRDRFCYVRDFDPDQGVVWFTAATPDGPAKTWQQGYRITAGAVELAGERTEVRERVVYEPVTATTTEGDARAFKPEQADRERGKALVETAASTTTQTPDGIPPAGSTAPKATTTAKESDMTDTTVKDAATREAEEAVRTREALELAQYRQADTARTLLDTKLAESTLPALAQNRVRAQFPATSLPLQESDRTLDVTTFTKTVEAAIKAEGDYTAGILEAAGVGRVTGNGAAQGAGSGMPATFLTQPSTGGFFGPASASAPITEAQAAQDANLRESLIGVYLSRGHSRAAAEKAVDANN